MQHVLETVKIKGPDGNQVTINKSDFDADKHELFGEVVAIWDKTVAEMKDFLAEIGVELPADCKKKADVAEFVKQAAEEHTAKSGE